MEAVSEALEANQDDFFEVVLHIQTDDKNAAVIALKEAASRNSVALQAITFLLADKLTKAEEAIMKVKLRRGRRER
jgi:hypothetical protein